MLSRTAQSVMDGEGNEQIGVGEDWVCFDVEKEYGGEEDVVLWPHRPEERYGEKIDARACIWKASGSSQIQCNQQRPGSTGFERMD